VRACVRACIALQAQQDLERKQAESRAEYEVLCLFLLLNFKTSLYIP